LQNQAEPSRDCDLMTELMIVLLTAILLNITNQVMRPGVELSPDGQRYLAMGGGRPVALPFALRWLLPAVCGSSPIRWRWCTAIHLMLLPPLVTVWLSGWVREPRLAAIGGILVCGLPGIWRTHFRWPVLVDAAAMTWAIGSAVALQHNWYTFGVALALVAGCIKETGPIFAACYAWNPLALAGLVAPVIRRLTVKVGDPFDELEAAILAHPLQAGLTYHSGRWLDPLVMAAPWGMCVLAIFTKERSIIPMVVTTVSVAYAQLLVATDSVRLYQWAAPPVILATMTVIPARWAIIALFMHLLNPWAGKGV
jgi:hypothetical protein